MPPDSGARAPVGRPSAYTRVVADLICDRLAMGETLRAICREEGMPPESTVRRWAAGDVDGFSARYMRARETGCYAMADDLLEIADDGRNDWIERARRDGTKEPVLDKEAVMRSSLRVDTRKWLLSKVLPRVFGNRPELPDDTGGVDAMTRDIDPPVLDRGTA